MVSILELVQQGLIAAKIATLLQMKKSHISYYITKAKNQGYITQVTRDTFSVLKVTQTGKNLIDQYKHNNPSIPICRLENIQFKARILQMPTIPIDWKKIQMRNWAQYTSQIDNVKVRINMGTNPTLEILPSPVDGDNPNDLIVTTVYECINAILNLYERIGLKVDKLQVSSRPEWLVYDPVAREFCKNNGQVTYDGIGKVNASRPRQIGEIEFNDPRALIEYLNMPTMVKNIQNEVNRISIKINELHKGTTLDK